MEGSPQPPLPAWGRAPSCSHDTRCPGGAVRAGVRGSGRPRPRRAQRRKTRFRVGGLRSSCQGLGPICMREAGAEISLTNHRLQWPRPWEAQRHLSPPRPASATPTAASRHGHTGPTLADGASCSLLLGLGEESPVSSPSSSWMKAGSSYPCPCPCPSGRHCIPRPSTCGARPGESRLVCAGSSESRAGRPFWVPKTVGCGDRELALLLLILHGG